METTVPGIKAKHLMITDNCRKRGKSVAADDALGQLADQLAKSMEGWPEGEGTKFHLLLTVERSSDKA